MATWLPSRWPQEPQIVWRRDLSGPALAGLAATEQRLIVVDREGSDRFDIYRCLDSQTGEELWNLRDLARGQLDYGNSPRATPLIHDELVYLFNAFGKLQCVRLDTGELVWKKDLRKEFDVEDDSAWGTCSSPLIVDDMLIVNPGGPEASIVALNPRQGTVIWQTPGDLPAYGSFIAAEIHGRRQLIGYDRTSLGGWNLVTGERLWTLKPPQSFDFNVPTPIVLPLGPELEPHLIVSTENNGTRLYRFDEGGKIVAQPLAENLDLAPDCHTPVALWVPTAGSGTTKQSEVPRLFGVWQRLYCLDLQAPNALQPLWTYDDRSLAHYASLIASGDRVLLTTTTGELLLIDATSDTFRLISRTRVFDDEEGLYSHPAIVGRRVFLRGSDEVVCVNLDESP